MNQENSKEFNIDDLQMTDEERQECKIMLSDQKAQCNFLKNEMLNDDEKLQVDLLITEIRSKGKTIPFGIYYTALWECYIEVMETANNI